MADPTKTYQGPSCNRCHGTLRFRDGHCVKCHRDKNRERYHTGYRYPQQLHPLYPRWLGIKQRCYNPKCSNYKWYGARGITMCDRWLQSFTAFATDIGLPPSPEHTIDRIDNNGPYAPSNVRWELPRHQTRNSRKAKLTLEDAREIRRLYVPGRNSGKLATRFGIKPAMIIGIVTGRYWKE